MKSPAHAAAKRPAVEAQQSALALVDHSECDAGLAAELHQRRFRGHPAAGGAPKVTA